MHTHTHACTHTHMHAHTHTHTHTELPITLTGALWLDDFSKLVYCAKKITFWPKANTLNLTFWQGLKKMPRTAVSVSERGTVHGQKNWHNVYSASACLFVCYKSHFEKRQLSMLTVSVRLRKHTGFQNRSKSSVWISKSKQIICLDFKIEANHLLNWLGGGGEIMAAVHLSVLSVLLHVIVSNYRRKMFA